VSLHDEAYFGRHKELKNLLDAGVAIESRDGGGCTALFCACMNVAGGDKRPETVRLLLEAGADVNARNNFDAVPLHRACYRGHESIVRLLLDHGADVNAKDKNGNTPLHEAVWQANTDIIRLLIEKGADLQARNRQGHSPSDEAQKFGNAGVVSVLMASRETLAEPTNTGWDNAQSM